ncbi:MAG: insulinase family protein [Candidatus Aminicenantes bacterium]|nr:insulinase family protein [Candidatus Aminicenantes bacterium]
MIRINRFAYCLSLLTISMNIQLFAQDEGRLSFDITTFQLENGLRVILSEDFSLPLVSVVVVYNVGSVNEEPNKTGLALLLENLMFQGSKNIGPMQHIHFIQKIGGDLNAATTEDKTIFYQTVPSNQLALVLWLESDRMMALGFDAQKIERTKRSLIDEIQHRKADDPYFDSAMYFDRLLYPSDAYSHPVVGGESDLRAMTIEDVKKFYDTYYSPNNAVLCITGNFSRRKAKSLVKKYFETIPKGEPIPPFPAENHSTHGEIVRTLENYTAPTPGFYLGYRIASSTSIDFFALTIIEYILLKGRSSRLYNRLFQRDRTARHISGGIESRKNLATLKIFVRNNTNTMMDRSQKAIFSEIGKLKTELISDEELLKAKNMFKIDYVNQYVRLVDRAIFLADRALTKNTTDGIAEELGEYLAVTPSIIIGIANRYLTKESILLNIRTK